MNRNIQGVSRNGNQGGSGRSRPESATGSQSLGRFCENSQALGARATSAARSCHDQAAGDHRSRPIGGQASGPGLFGIRITGNTGSAPQAAAVRPVQQTQQARLVGDDQPRRVGGLSFGQRRAIVCGPSPTEIERRNAAMRAAALASDLRQEREWHEYAELVETNPTLPYGSVETACALNH